MVPTTGLTAVAKIFSWIKAFLDHFLEPHTILFAINFDNGCFFHLFTVKSLLSQFDHFPHRFSLCPGLRELPDLTILEVENWFDVQCSMMSH